MAVSDECKSITKNKKSAGWWQDSNKLNWRIWKCVNWDQMISGYDTFFDFGVKFDILGFSCSSYFFLLKTFISKTASLRYVFDKVPSAKWPHKPGENIMFLSKSAL